MTQRDDDDDVYVTISARDESWSGHEYHSFHPFPLLSSNATVLRLPVPERCPSLPLIIRIAMRAIRCKYNRKMTKVGGGSQLIFIAGEKVAFLSIEI